MESVDVVKTEAVVADQKAEDATKSPRSPSKRKEKKEKKESSDADKSLKRTQSKREKKDKKEKEKTDDIPLAKSESTEEKPSTPAPQAQPSQPTQPEQAQIQASQSQTAPLQPQPSTEKRKAKKETLVHEGFLYKKDDSGVIKNWKRRYFRLYTTKLDYYTVDKDVDATPSATPSDTPLSSPTKMDLAADSIKGSIYLNGILSVEPLINNANTNGSLSRRASMKNIQQQLVFLVKTNARTWNLRAESAGEMEEWLNFLRKYVPAAPAATDTSTTTSASTTPNHSPRRLSSADTTTPVATLSPPVSGGFWSRKASNATRVPSGSTADQGTPVLLVPSAREIGETSTNVEPVEEAETAPEVPQKQLVAGDVAVTIYTSGACYVQEVRQLQVPANQNRSFTISEIPRSIIPTSVQFRSLNHPEDYVQEQRFLFERRDEASLLARLCGKAVTITLTTTATSTSDTTVTKYSGVVMKDWQDEANIVLLDTSENKIVHILNVLKDKPENVTVSYQLHDNSSIESLLPPPSLQWTLSSDNSDHLAELSYQLTGVNWRVSYEAILNPHDTALQLQAWLTLAVANIGCNYQNARLTLVDDGTARAKTNNNSNNNQPNYDDFKYKGFTSIPKKANKSRSGSVSDDEDQGSSSVLSKTLKVHSEATSNSYVLPFAVHLESNSRKQVRYLSAASVPVKRVNLVHAGYRFDGELQTQERYRSVVNLGAQTVISFVNNKDSLGIDTVLPLPAGTWNILRRGADGFGLNEVSQCSTSHHAVNDSVHLAIGPLSSVSAHRRQVSFHLDAKARGGPTMTESFEVTLQNAGRKSVAVSLEECLYRWKTFSIVSAQPEVSHAHKEENKIFWTLTLPPKDKLKVTYTVQYTNFVLQN